MYASTKTRRESKADGRGSHAIRDPTRPQHRQFSPGLSVRMMHEPSVQIGFVDRLEALAEGGGVNGVWVFAQQQIDAVALFVGTSERSET